MARKSFEFPPDIELHSAALSRRFWRLIINGLCKAAECEEDEAAAAEYAELATDLDKYIVPFD